MKFRCERCSYCCTLRVELGFFELFRILLKGYKKKDFAVKNMLKKNCIKQFKNHDCYFLIREDGKASCRIYDIRPKTCRKYPGYVKGTCKKVNPAVREYLKKN